MIVRITSRKNGGYFDVVCDKFYVQKTDDELKIVLTKNGITSVARMGKKFLPRVKVIKK